MSEGEDSGEEKAFDPTPQRLEEARKKGDVPRTPDLSVAAAYAGFLLSVLAFGPDMMRKLGERLTGLLMHPEAAAKSLIGSSDTTALGLFMLGVAGDIAPLLGLPIAAVLIGLIAERAIVFAPDKIQPKLSRVDPLGNLKQKFSGKNLFDFLKSFLKLIFISLAVLFSFSGRIEETLETIYFDSGAVALRVAESVATLAILILSIAAVIAVPDFLFQRYNHNKRLRMSFQDMKEEVKKSEGDPHVKGQRRQRAQEIASGRMMQDVPTASVVIVNPEHYAVALKWDRQRGTAPVCVAKGVDHVAFRIRQIATEANVPIHSDPPTARALHATTQIGAEIDPEHYRAVAAAIRFADQMRRKMRARG